MSQSAADLVIYGSPVSPFVRKVAAACIEKKIDFEIEGVDVFNPPQWFADISPMKRIPVLRDRAIAAVGPDGTIADSSAICAYIERKEIATPLYPAEAFDHARALFIEEYADTYLAATGGLGIFRPIFFSISQGKEPDMDRARATWSEKIPPILGYLDGSLEGGDFFVGADLTIADITVTACMMQMALVADLDLSPYPELAAHYERMAARASIAGPYAQADAIVRKVMPDRVALS